jgi:hypothetical protein
MATPTFVQFNGIPIQCYLTLEELQEQRDEVIRNYMIEGYTISEIKKDIFTELVGFHKDLKQKFGGSSCNLRDVMKFWKGEALFNTNFWLTGVMILIKLKAITQDENNGWLELTLDDERVDKTNPIGKSIKASFFNACATCGQMGKPDKCSGCSKVHYCSAECQKQDWKAHKPNCHK